MRKVKDAVDLTTNEKIYFKGHAKATYLSDGRNVEEAISNLPSGESSVFAAVWGETSYEELKAAFEARKICTCVYNNVMYNAISLLANDEIQFVATTLTSHFRLSCTSSRGWSTPTAYEVEKASNKVTSLSSASTDTQYPSAKAVYDFVSNTLGTIINGDY